jgi:hypothetical protein
VADPHCGQYGLSSPWRSQPVQVRPRAVPQCWQKLPADGCPQVAQWGASGRAGMTGAVAAGIGAWGRLHV